jgi:hypothetical protein
MSESDAAPEPRLAKPGEPAYPAGFPYGGEVWMLPFSYSIGAPTPREKELIELFNRDRRALAAAVADWAAKLGPRDDYDLCSLLSGQCFCGKHSHCVTQ